MSNEAIQPRSLFHFVKVIIPGSTRRFNFKLGPCIVMSRKMSFIFEPQTNSILILPSIRRQTER